MKSFTVTALLAMATALAGTVFATPAPAPAKVRWHYLPWVTIANGLNDLHFLQWLSVETGISTGQLIGNELAVMWCADTVNSIT